MDEDLLEELDGLDDEIETLRNEYRSLREELEKRAGERQEMVEALLYDFQDELQPDEQVPLIDGEEWSRGGHYVFTEAMTPEGVIVTDVQRVFKGHGYTFDEEGNRVQLDDDDVGEEYWIEGDDKYREASPGALYGWDAEEQPLDVDQYLSGRRASTGFVDKLAERLQYIDEGIDEVPSNGWGYD